MKTPKRGKGVEFGCIGERPKVLNRTRHRHPIVFGPLSEVKVFVELNMPRMTKRSPHSALWLTMELNDSRRQPIVVIEANAA